MVKTFKYCNGDSGAVSPCTISAISPATIVEDATQLDGWGPVTDVLKRGHGLNLGSSVDDKQPFTDIVAPSTGINVPYDATLNIGNQLPLVFDTDEEGSITCSSFNESMDPDGRPYINSRDIFTVAAQDPPTGAFRPGVAAASKVSTRVEGDMIDLSTLPTLSMPSLPSFEALSNIRWDQAVEFGNANYFDKVNPERNIPGRFGPRGPGINSALAVLALCADIPAARKRDIAVAIVQFAIDLEARGDRIDALSQLDWGGVNGASGLGAINHRGYKIILLTAGILMDDAAFTSMGQNRMFAEDGAYSYVTQTMIDDGVEEPGQLAGGFAQYEQMDLGMPEWTQGNRLVTNAGNRLESDSYRADCKVLAPRHAMAIHLFPGLYSAWPAIDRDPFIEYADRTMERTFFSDGSGTFQYARGGSRLSQFDRDVWDDYRVSQGQTSVWDWPA